MNMVIYYIGIAAIIIFILRFVYYLGYRKGFKHGMLYLMPTVEKFFLSIKKECLYKLLVEYIYVENGGDPNKLRKEEEK